MQKIITVTKDICANEKILRKLERNGHIELFINEMELPVSGSKIKNRNSLPFGFKCDDPTCKCQDGIGSFGNASKECPYSYWIESEHKELLEVINSIIGSANRRDSKQLFHHYINKRDVFVTEDNDILSKSTDLYEKLQIIIKTPYELVEFFLSNKKNLIFTPPAQQ